MKRIYLDNNATAPLDPLVVESLITLLQTPLGNPSSPHAYGQLAKGLVSEARRHVAAFLKVKQSQILFTSGGAEGAALCIYGILKEKRPAHIITSNIEHACVYEILEDLSQQGTKITFLPAGFKGAIRPEDLLHAIRPETDLIVLMAANNETGVVQDIEAVAAIAERHQIPLVVDGVALLGKGMLRIPSGVSAMFFSGHKIHAPQGVGFVYTRIKLKSQIRGGSQEFGMRGGTENLLGIAGLSKAVSLLSQNQEMYIKHIRNLRDCFENALLGFPGVTLNGTAPRVCNTSNLAFTKIDGETLLIHLDQAGIAASLGSACSSGSIEPSRVLIAMGVPLETARSSLRFSFSRLNTLEEVERAIEIIKSFL